MHPIPPLAAMGRRIMVNGPSNAGKSTLADAIATKIGAAVVHLDRLSHEEHGLWVPRDKDEFHALHNTALTGDAWVMDGNYSELMPQRFSRATGVIVIDDHFVRATDAISIAPCFNADGSAASPATGMPSVGK